MNGDLRPISRESASTYRIGVAAIAFGWLYPHFLERHVAAYLYASAVGLIPCPTLAVATGFALLGNGLGSRLWSLTLAAAGLLYGLFGVLRLGVFLDLGLVAGAVALAGAAFRSPAAGHAWHESQPGFATTTRHEGGMSKASFGTPVANSAVLAHLVAAPEADQRPTIDGDVRREH